MFHGLIISNSIDGDQKIGNIRWITKIQEEIIFCEK